MKTARPCACGKPVAKHRTICSACHSLKTARANPLKAAFRYLKGNAKRRKKDFSLTLEQFAQFCIETTYLDKKGRTATSFTIDRIDPTQGYHIWNIQALENRENVLKQVREQRTVNCYNPETGRREFFTISTNPSPPTYCPF
ncbi:hypothetical protein GCM10023185_13380 [Hymenobacter saemangeumensis]|uniref:Uncharacterized protein n=1 Tax=Hymenobacter saemangeumensis TaxID=1084522 RepID=A0ABP8I7M8_9BACT